MIRGIISFHAATSACERGGPWQRALSLISQEQDVGVTHGMISFSAASSACDKGLVVAAGAVVDQSGRLPEPIN